MFAVLWDLADAIGIFSYVSSECNPATMETGLPQDCATGKEPKADPT